MTKVLLGLAWTALVAYNWVGAFTHGVNPATHFITGTCALVILALVTVTVAIAGGLKS